MLGKIFFTRDLKAKEQRQQQTTKTPAYGTLYSPAGIRYGK